MPSFTRSWRVDRAASVPVLTVLVTLALIVDYQPAQAIAPNFVNEIVAEGFTLPVQMVFAPDGRIFVAEKDGKIKIIAVGGTAPLATPLVTLPNVYTNQESGISGMMLAPDFNTSG